MTNRYKPETCRRGRWPPPIVPDCFTALGRRRRGAIWVPYAQEYTHVMESSGVAYEFVYYPRFGWRWVLSPWVFALGPRPYFVHGPVRFAWYAHPWFRAHPLVQRKVVREHRRR
jgi:hypothetical protein